MAVYCFEMDDWQQQAFQRANPNTEFTVTTDRLSADTVENYADARLISSFVYSNLGHSILEKMPDLKFIATRSTGYDHVDLDYCRAHNITVSNVPAYGSETVAEHVFALLLALSRNIPKAARGTREGHFNYEGLCGFDLCDKTIGVIGTGGIGGHAARIATGFSMKVLGYDLEPDDSLPCTYTDLETLLANADIITLHVPGKADTYQFIGEKQFNMMKDGVILINTARGSVIESAALLKALYAGKVAAAGLDVLPSERAIHDEQGMITPGYFDRHNADALLIDQALMRHQNVLVTPHSAFFTREAMIRILQTTADNVRGWLDNKPVNIVT